MVGTNELCIEIYILGISSAKATAFVVLEGCGVIAWHDAVVNLLCQMMWMIMVLSD